MIKKIAIFARTLNKEEIPMEQNLTFADLGLSDPSMCSAVIRNDLSFSIKSSPFSCGVLLLNDLKAVQQIENHIVFFYHAFFHMV